MDHGAFKKEIEVTLGLIQRAALATETIRQRGIEAVDKEDGSPLTQADIVSQAIILQGLRERFPEDRIVAEEEVQLGEAEVLREAACQVLQEMGFTESEEKLLEWVNYRGNPRGSRLWMIDPIDGTKGFKKGLCYAIAIGLYYDGRPRFGCMGAPLFPDDEKGATSTRIACAAAGVGAYGYDSKQDRLRRIHVSDVDKISRLRLIGSRAHDRGDLCRKFTEKAGVGQFSRMDGQAKYLMLATGQADVHLRAVDPVFGIGYPWDHCAGQVILEEAGGVATGFDGRPLNYDQLPGSPIKDLDGLVASNALCHETILELVREIASSQDDP